MRQPIKAYRGGPLSTHQQPPFKMRFAGGSIVAFHGGRGLTWLPRLNLVECSIQIDTEK